MMRKLLFAVLGLVIMVACAPATESGSLGAPDLEATISAAVEATITAQDATATQPSDTGESTDRALATPTSVPDPTPTPVPAATPTSVPIEKWIVSEILEDVLTGEKSTVVLLDADEGRSKWNDKITLMIGCTAGRHMSLAIDWHEFISTEDPPVEYRVGEGPLQRSIWSVSGRLQTTFHRASFSNHNVVPFIQSMFGETQFIARVTPYGEVSRTAIFDITGIENAVMNVRQLCGW